MRPWLHRAADDRHDQEVAVRRRADVGEVVAGTVQARDPPGSVPQCAGSVEREASRRRGLQSRTQGPCSPMPSATSTECPGVQPLADGRLDRIGDDELRVGPEPVRDAGDCRRGRPRRWRRRARPGPHQARTSVRCRENRGGGELNSPSSCSVLFQPSGMNVVSPGRRRLTTVGLVRPSRECAGLGRAPAGRSRTKCSAPSRSGSGSVRTGWSAGAWEGSPGTREQSPGPRERWTSRPSVAAGRCECKRKRRDGQRSSSSKRPLERIHCVNHLRLPVLCLGSWRASVPGTMSRASVRLAHWSLLRMEIIRGTLSHALVPMPIRAPGEREEPEPNDSAAQERLTTQQPETPARTLQTSPEGPTMRSRRLLLIAAIAALTSLGGATITSAHTLVDPTTLTPLLLPFRVCYEDGPWVKCDTSGTDTIENDPVFDLPCGTIYETATAIAHATRWYENLLLVERDATLRVRGTWSLSATGSRTHGRHRREPRLARDDFSYPATHRVFPRSHTATSCASRAWAPTFETSASTGPKHASRAGLVHRRGDRPPVRAADALAGFA